MLPVIDSVWIHGGIIGEISDVVPGCFDFDRKLAGLLRVLDALHPRVDRLLTFQARGESCCRALKHPRPTLPPEMKSQVAPLGHRRPLLLAVKKRPG